MPIHGVLKSCLPRIHFQWQHVFSGDSDSTTLAFALLAALVGAGLLLAGRRAGRSLRGLGLGAAMLALIQIAAFTLFQKWSKPIPVWYFGPAVVAGTFALAAGIANVVGPRRLRTVAVVAGLAVLTVNVAAAARAWYRDLARGSIDARAATEDTAARIVEFMKTTPGDRIWACTDCGKLAFWSGRRVVNLDGLINDFAYQKALRDRRLAQYLADKGVRYLVFLVWDRPQCERGVYEPMYECRVAPDLFSGAYRSAGFYVYSYQYMNYSDIVRLPREAEVWRSPATRDGQAQGRAVVFDLQIALHGSGALPR
jgi:hypothetical protein